MAIIDLRNIVEPEHDIIKIIGNDDRKEYSIPVKKTMGMIIMLNQYFADYMRTVKPDEMEAIKNIELNYRMVTAWMRGVYADITLEWVKNNICEELFKELVRILEPLFFSKDMETGTPEKKNRKKV